LKASSRRSKTTPYRQLLEIKFAGMPVQTNHPTHIDNMGQNLAVVRRLIEIHSEVAGQGPGYKADVEVLNKSAIVMLVACWESFVEDLVSGAFDLMLANATSHKVFPDCVLTLASKNLKDAQDTRLVWQLAGTGWQAILKSHKQKLVSKYVDSFNTPRAENVDAMFSNLLGLSQISSSWSWKGMSSAQAKQKLSDLVTLRGSIAHKVATSEAVHKADVRDYLDFIRRLSVTTSNQVQTFIRVRIGIEAWPKYSITKK
jgi:hypothetical protein